MERDVTALVDRLTFDSQRDTRDSHVAFVSSFGHGRNTPNQFVPRHLNVGKDQSPADKFGLWKILIL